MANKIEPISGFPEYLPQQQLAFNAITAKIKAVYESFGYVPLETPAVERIDTLTSKGIDSKEVYGLRRLNVNEGESGDKELALRFDLTVPLARYVAQHYANLTFPFRRYQCQPVWRGERPKAGRYRQFHQFDLDIIADGPLPLAADAEVITAAHQALTALGLKFVMRVNNRKALRGLLEVCGFNTDEHIYQAIKVIDDLEKLSGDKIKENLEKIRSNTNVEALLYTIKNRKVHDSIKDAINNNYKDGVDDITTVIQTAKGMLDLPNNTSEIRWDLTIARGLDYYTGTVIETTLLDAPELGSICSGGRYDNLTESLSERKLPGVGVSIGISRLASWLMQQPEYAAQAASTAHALLPCVEASQLPAISAAAAELRKQGLNIEQTLTPGPLGAQLQKAEKRGLTHAILLEDGETLTLRTFATRKDEKGLSPTQIAAKLKA